jgi:hypothetical protein
MKKQQVGKTKRLSRLNSVGAPGKYATCEEGGDDWWDRDEAIE